jgi:hypothetical protein
VLVSCRVLRYDRVCRRTLLPCWLRTSRKEDTHILLRAIRRLGRAFCLEWLRYWMCSRFQMSCQYRAKTVSCKHTAAWCVDLMPSSIRSSHLRRQCHPHSPIDRPHQNSNRQNHILPRSRSRRKQRINRGGGRPKSRIRHRMDIGRPRQIRPPRTSHSRKSRLRRSRPEIQRRIR